LLVDRKEHIELPRQIALTIGTFIDSTASPEDPACAKPPSQYVGDEIHCSGVGMGQGLLNSG